MTKDQATELFQLPTGSTLAYREYGDPGGQPLFYFHGTPGARHEPATSHPEGLEWGFRIVAPDRPYPGRGHLFLHRHFADVFELSAGISNKGTIDDSI